MKPKSRAFRPGALHLEDRAMLSSVADVASLATTTRIAGKLPGHYQAGIDNRAADAPLHVNLNGNGQVKGQGRIKLAGSLDLGGFKVAGSPEITGTVTLKNAKGSITLQLTGSGGSSQVPKHRFVLDATITGGTGLYATLEGDGTATAAFAKSTLRAKKPHAPIAGTATFTLNLNATIG